MKATDFSRGDHLSMTIVDEAGTHTKDFYLHEVDEELVTYHPFDGTCPVVPFTDEFLDYADNNGGTITVIKRAADALPTEPGEYQDVSRQLILGAIAGTNFEEDVTEGISDKPWVLNEDGTWTSPAGETRGPEDNWLLVAGGFRFVPWDTRDMISELYKPEELGPDLVNVIALYNTLA